MNVTTSGSSVNIGRITLTCGPTSGTLDIVIGSGSLNTSDSSTTPTGNDWGGLDVSAIASGVETRLSGAIGDDLTDSIGIDQLFRFDFIGEVQASITAANPGNFGGVCVVEAGSIATGGSVTLTNGALLRVRTDGTGDIAGDITATNGRIDNVFVGGDLFGDVKAESGRIGQIVAGGDIGASGSPVTITAKQSDVSIHSIRSISADNIHANITSNLNFVPGTGLDAKIGRIKAETGVITGSITTRGVAGTVAEGAGGVCSTGNFSADIASDLSIESTLDIGGELLSGTTVRIGALSSGGSITIDANAGLEGQIIITDAFSNGGWFDPVTIGTGGSQIVIDPANTSFPPEVDYTQTSAQLGGGAIGVVPFDNHRADCSPLEEAFIEQPANVPSTIRIRHYGPITFAWGTMPYVITRKLYPCDSDPWAECCQTSCGATDISNLFTAALGSSANGGTARDVILTPVSGFTWPDDRTEFCFKPVTSGTNRLKCSGVPNEPSVYAYKYRFLVGIPCGSADLVGGDGEVDSADLAAWMQNPIDLNGDGLANDADLALILQAMGETE
ncbi:MAG: hypothetical protein H7Y88_10405 [Phycisphaerales bacterium]|nr:hypothetical protein [Phycisphaerales bacterium]